MFISSNLPWIVACPTYQAAIETISACFRLPTSGWLWFTQTEDEWQNKRMTRHATVLATDCGGSNGKLLPRIPL